MVYFLIKPENKKQKKKNCSVGHEPVRVSPEEGQEGDQKAGAPLL